MWPRFNKAWTLPELRHHWMAIDCFFNNSGFSIAFCNRELTCNLMTIYGAPFSLLCWNPCGPCRNEVAQAAENELQMLLGCDSTQVLYELELANRRKKKKMRCPLYAYYQDTFVFHRVGWAAHTSTSPQLWSHHQWQQRHLNVSDALSTHLMVSITSTTSGLVNGRQMMFDTRAAKELAD